MRILTDLPNRKTFLLGSLLLFLAAEAAPIWLGSTLYIVSLVIAGIYLVRHCTEALWVGFVLLAITTFLYPIQIDEGVPTPGTFRPYIGIVALMAVSIGIGSRTQNRHDKKSRHNPISKSMTAFVAVMLVALSYGYLTTSDRTGLLDVLRECSGWMTFLVFIFLGYRYTDSSEATQRAFAKLFWSSLAYSIVFTLTFVYLSLSQATDLVVFQFGYPHRVCTYFSALVLVLLGAQAQRKKLSWSVLLYGLYATILLTAVLLSGFRSVIGAALIVCLMVATVRNPKAVGFGFVVAIVVAAIFLGPIMASLSQQDQGEGITRYISQRFLAMSENDASLLARASEWLAVADAVRKNPWLGIGPLATYSFFDPLFGWRDTTFIDSGIGYLLLKTGLLGTIIFTWFAISWLKLARNVQVKAPTIGKFFLASFLFFLAYMPFGPSFFEFQHCWWIGLILGYTMRFAEVSSRVQRSVLAHGSIDPQPA